MTKSEIDRIKYQLTNADRILAMPDTVYKNGQSSHKMWSDEKERCLNALEDDKRLLLVTA